MDRFDPSTALDVELLTDGRIRVERPTSRDFLRDRLRGSLLLPTARSWSVLTGPAESGGASGARGPLEVVAAGTLGPGGLSIVDLLGFLSGAQQTGVLSVRGEHRRSAYLYRGDVVWASSSAPLERLGPYLAARGRLSRAQLQVSLRDVQGGVLRAALERGFVDLEDARALVQEYILERFEAVVGADRGVWSFARVDPEPLEAASIRRSGQQLLLEALRRLDERRVYQARLGPPGTRYRRSVETAPLSAASPALKGQPPGVLEHAQRAFESLDGVCDASDLARRSGLGEFDCQRALYVLIREEHVEAVEAERDTARERNPPVDRREVIHIHGLALAEMMAEADRAGRAPELRRRAEAFIQSQGPRMAMIQLAPTGHLDPEVLLGHPDLADVDGEHLHEVLGELLFFLLLQASELLGRRRGDDLARRVRLIHALIDAEGRSP